MRDPCLICGWEQNSFFAQNLRLKASAPSVSCWPHPCRAPSHLEPPHWPSPCLDDLPQTASCLTPSPSSLCLNVTFSLISAVTSTQRTHSPPFSALIFFSPYNLDDIIYLSRDWTCVSCVSCIAGGFFTAWAIRKALFYIIYLLGLLCIVCLLQLNINSMPSGISILFIECPTQKRYSLDLWWINEWMNEFTWWTSA